MDKEQPNAEFFEGLITHGIMTREEVEELKIKIAEDSLKGEQKIFEIYSKEELSECNLTDPDWWASLIQ